MNLDQAQALLEKLEQFLSVLELERAQLASGNANELQQTLREKLSLANDLAGANIDLGKLDSASALPAALKRDLIETSQACAFANRVNGGAIDLNRGFVARFLSVLRVGASTTPTYDAGGKVGHYRVSDALEIA
ncbi:MAG: flagellar protein FlgN [Pseudomonadota bacterium]